MFILFLAGALLGGAVTTTNDYHACKKAEFKGEMCALSKKLSKLHSDSILSTDR